MPIKGSQEFLEIFAKINDSHVKSYDNTVQSIFRWSESDFDVSGMDDELASTSNDMMVGCIKKTRDLVKAYHRAYRIHNFNREDYYRHAVTERRKDEAIVTSIIDNVNRTYDKLSYARELEK